MAEHNCETCKFRAYYEKKPASIPGKIWKWHTGWCPGWKKYTNSLTKEQRSSLFRKYNFKR